ncbi:MAG TPA: hypothetical protein VI914_04280 [Thermodesulfobacteriota bacterium]|nr:hypothetical protein [Thermodesulfobacteriota bacterium]
MKMLILIALIFILMAKTAALIVFLAVILRNLTLMSSSCNNNGIESGR